MSEKKSHIRFNDSTIFPHPDRVEELEWLCRHGDEKSITDNRLYIASVLHSYNYLVGSYSGAVYKNKKITDIRKYLRAETATKDSETLKEDTNDT